MFIPSLIREEFGLSAAVLFDARTARTYTMGDNSWDVEQLARNAYFRDKEEFDSDTRVWSWPLRLGARPVGGLVLCGGNLTPLIATAIASLSAIALERARSFENENRAEAARQIEQLRTGVLDALAHQFKTPLTVIMTASSGLLAGGSLPDPQAELITLIDEQAKELNEVTSRLLGAAELDGAHLKPQREPLLLSSIVKESLATLDDQQCRSRFQVSIADPEPQVLADSKLIETALAQLVDNAVKYSDPGSPIAIEVDAAEGEVIVTVRDQGLIITPADRDHIFERFYRGAGSEPRTAGTGLGLSIVQKIAHAHRGRVWVESDPEHGTAFSLALPAVGEQKAGREFS
jgi:two-component system sensor histidine kinase KdpD